MTQRKRWPDGAERLRQDALASIRTARELLRTARQLDADITIDLMKRNPQLAEMKRAKIAAALADTTTQLADAERALEIARHTF